MKTFDLRNPVFVGSRGTQAVIYWPGVAWGFIVFVGALMAGATLGWYLLCLATGADLVRGMPAVAAVSFLSGGVALVTVVQGTLQRPLAELPRLDR